jgi:uncharacterized protein GlcG (DUF336 family)
VGLGLKPLAVAVLDAGGHLIAFGRADGASTLRPQIACGKAGGALGLGVNSRKIALFAANRPSFIAALGPIAPHGVIPSAGGVLVLDEQGETIGAIGVTGDTADNDEICALAGDRRSRPDRPVLRPRKQKMFPRTTNIVI